MASIRRIWVPLADTGREPYPGRASSPPTRRDLYFGREADIDAMVRSLPRAGAGGGARTQWLREVVPRAGGADPAPGHGTHRLGGLRQWRPVIVDPGPKPTKSFLVGLMASEDAALRLPRETIEQCLTDDGVFSTAVLTCSAVLDERTGLLIVVDQLEQLFTACRDDTVRRAFGENLASAAAHCPDRARLVVTLRSDYLDELAKLPALARTVGARHHLLAPIDGTACETSSSARRGRPAWRSNHGVDEIALDVEDQPNALPMLSVALQEMWRAAPG